MDRLEMSPEIGELVKALVKVQKELKHPKKDKDNPYFQSKYADLTEIVETCRPILQNNGLAISQPCEITASGENVLVTLLMHESGQYIRGELKLIPEKNTPQGFGSAITYARRYCLASIVGIAPEEDDDDAEAAEGRGSEIKNKGVTSGGKIPGFKTVKPAEKKSAPAAKDDIKHWRDGDAKKGVCSKCGKKDVFCYIEGGLCYECKHS